MRYTSTQILIKLKQAWTLTPELTFGQLVESVENIAWDMFQKISQREFSMRLLHLPDNFFEAALDQWINDPLKRKINTP